jgi:tetrahydromethanopterin S-methyltransferase subunit F
MREFEIKVQSELFWFYKDEIERCIADETMSIDTVIELLRYNKQYVGKPGKVKPWVLKCL